MGKKFIVILVLVPFVTGCSLANQANQDVMSPEAAKTKAESFVNEFLIEGEQQTAEITEITEEEGLYKLAVKIGDQEFESYMTKGGKKFFTSAVDMENPNGQAGANGSDPQAGGQPQMSVSEQAQSLVLEGRNILDQYGEILSEQDQAEFSAKVDELENLAGSTEATPEELQAKMQEVQTAGEPLIQEIIEQQEQEQSVQTE